MIHIDNNVISFLAQDKIKAKAFYKYLAASGKDVLLNCILLYENMNSTDQRKVDERIKFIRKIPRKIYLNPSSTVKFC